MPSRYDQTPDGNANMPSIEPTITNPIARRDAARRPRRDPRCRAASFRTFPRPVTRKFDVDSVSRREFEKIRRKSVRWPTTRRLTIQTKVEEQPPEAPRASHPGDVGSVTLEEPNGIPSLALKVPVSIAHVHVEPRGPAECLPSGHSRFALPVGGERPKTASLREELDVRRFRSDPQHASRHGGSNSVLPSVS